MGYLESDSDEAVSDPQLELYVKLCIVFVGCLELPFLDLQATDVEKSFQIPNFDFGLLKLTVRLFCRIHLQQRHYRFALFLLLF